MRTSPLKKGIIAAAAIAAGVGLMLVAGRLPFVPSWRFAPVCLVCGGAVLAGSAAMKLARSILVRAGALLVLGALTLGLVWTTFGVTNIAGEELIRIVEDRGRSVFLYECSGVPDGLIASRVAVRDSWLPFEHTVVRSRSAIVELRTEGDQLVLEMPGGTTERHSFRERPVPDPTLPSICAQR